MLEAQTHSINDRSKHGGILFLLEESVNTDATLIVQETREREKAPQFPLQITKPGKNNFEKKRLWLNLIPEYHAKFLNKITANKIQLFKNIIHNHVYAYHKLDYSRSKKK